MFQIQELIKVINQGLTRGMGPGRLGPGNLCIEAAVCYTLGLPHSDHPPCVGDAVRKYAILLNDCAWPSKAARAEGMLAFGVAHMGSNVIDQDEFCKTLRLKIIRSLLPRLLEDAPNDHYKVSAKCQKYPSPLALEWVLEDVFGFEGDEYWAIRLCCKNLLHTFYRHYAMASWLGHVAQISKQYSLMADLGVETLVELKSPGAEFLEELNG